MTFPMGGGRINPDPCTDDEWRDFAQSVSQDVFNLQTLVVEGAIDNYTFAETDGGTPGFWDAKVAGEGEFDAEVHQTVGYYISGGIIYLFTAQGGEGGGADGDEKVKATSTGTAGYLSEVIDGSSWVGTTAYNATTHFSVLASPVGGDTVHFYAPANIIKNSAADGAPGFLAAKQADLTGTAYNADIHTLVVVQNTGSTLRYYVADADIEAVVAAMSLGAVRYCKIPASATVNVATDTAGDVTPGTTTGLVELVRNVGTGVLELGDTLTNVIYPDFTPVTVISGRYKIGKLMPDNSDPTKLVLFDVSCYSKDD